MQAEHPLFYQRRRFLSESELAWLSRFVLERERVFRPSTVSNRHGKPGNVDRSARRSKVLHPGAGVMDPFVEKVRKELPGACKELGLVPFPIGRVECQITASNHGDFFRVHMDNGTASSRRVSYVYFFQREGRPFTGGELRIFDNADRYDFFYFFRQWAQLIPERNSIIWFRSDRRHEILPVSCPTRRFHDSRFTVNGWVHSISF